MEAREQREENNYVPDCSGSKECIACGITKDATEFGVDCSRPDGLRICGQTFDNPRTCELGRKS